MKRITASIILLASVTAAGYAIAQDSDQADTDEIAIEASEAVNPGKRFNREPIDLATFSRLDDVKAADTDGDGTLSREEIEAYALKRVVQRMADRMERRLDVDGDGTVTLAEIENQKQKEFAALDRNEDGKLDRREMRAGKSFGNHANHHGNHRGHGSHQFRR